MSDAPEPAEREPADNGHSLAQWALDALVFAPAGLILTAVEDLPAMAAKGRARLELQMRNAHLLGRFAVQHGRRDLERRLGREAGGGRQEGAATAAPAAETGPPAAVAKGHGPGPADLAIPEYDTLSASQVVRRLDGLGPKELEAVYRHEAATRGRRTILHRAQQLLGSEDVPGR